MPKWKTHHHMEDKRNAKDGQQLSKAELRPSILLILLISLRLKLILIRSNRSRAANPLQLTLHIVVNMILVVRGRSATPATDSTTRTTTFIVIIQDR